MIYLLLTWLISPLLWMRCVLRGQRGVRKILVLQTAKIGDFVVTRPVFLALRAAYPDASLCVLLHRATEPLARHMPEIDQCLTLPEQGYKGWKGKIWLYRLLGSLKPDVVLTLSPNMSTFLIPFWAGIHDRISVLPDRRQGLARYAWPFLSHGEPHIPGRMFAESAMQTLRGLGLRPESVDAQRSRLFCTPEGVHQRERLFAADRGPFVGLGIGAGNRMKALGFTSLQSLAEQILGSGACTLVLIGTAADQKMAEQLMEQFPGKPIIDTTGQWCLEDLPALLAGLDGLIGVDSGATYIADNLGVPVLDIMGPADSADQRPTGPGALILSSQEPCAPCSHAFDAPYQCKYGHRKCLEGNYEIEIDVLIEGFK